MAEAVAAHGYPGTTVQELVAKAGVSNSTFYENFRNKQECFFATSQGIVEKVGGEIARAFMEPDDLRKRLTAGLETLMRIASERPAEVSLVIVDSLTLGAAGAEHREQASEAAVAMLERGFAEAPQGSEINTFMARALVSGIRGVVYWRLRAGRHEELPEAVDELVEWVLCYQQPPGELAQRVAAAAAEPLPPAPAGEEALSWDEPPDSARSRRALTQRERLVRATARIAFERSYQALSIPAISGTAGVSNQTFYAHFASKEEAFVGAFEALAGDLVTTAVGEMTRAGDQPEALGVGIRALLEYLAKNKMFTKIAFFEVPMAGPQALDRGDSVLDAFTAYLQPGVITSAITHPLPRTIQEAIGTAVWGVLQYEIYRGRQDSLAELAPQIARLAFTPIDCRLGA